MQDDREGGGEGDAVVPGNGRVDSLFPAPSSQPGRMLGYLVSRQVPGTQIDTTLGAVAAGAGLARTAATHALSQLADDGFIIVDPGPDPEHITVMVLMAPPADEYGLRTLWGNGPGPEAGGRGPGETLKGEATMEERAAAQKEVLSPDAPGQTGPAARTRRGTARRAAPRGGATNQPLPIAMPEASEESHVAEPAAPEPAAPEPAAPEPAAPEPAAPEPAAPEPAAADATAAGTTTPRGRRGAATPAAAAATVDDTALVRGFVERFERLLAETDEWRRRAQEAEERASTTEKQLRAAERRAEAAESKLEAAQERLRAWSELTRRMQQLSRQADSAGKTRGQGGRTAKMAAEG